MCVANKFFFIVPLDLGCLILGFCTFFLGAITAMATATLLIMDMIKPGTALSLLFKYPKHVMNEASVTAILATVMVLALFWMLFSVLLILGIRRSKSSFVLWYFSFATMLTILTILSALLVLIENYWILALIKVLMSLIYIHCLVVVHSTYELMLAGTVFKFSYKQQSDEELLVDSMDG